MLIQRMVSAVGLSLMAWTIYHLNFSITTPVLLAVCVYVLISLVLAKAAQRRNGSTKHAASLSAAWWSTVWTLVCSGALFGLYGAATVWFKYAAHAAVTNFWLWFLQMVGITILFFVFLFLAGLQIALQEVSGKAAIRHGYDAPVIGFMLVCKKGGSYLTKGTYALLAAWAACIVEFHTWSPYGSFAAFLLLLVSFGWLTNTRGSNMRSSAAESSRGATFARWTGLSFVFLFLMFYFLLAQDFIAILSQLLAFIMIAIVMTIILLICFGLIKLRLFAIVKWLMIVLMYPFFAGWVLFMWTVSQP